VKSAILAAHDIQPSMSRVGNPYDNAKAKSFMNALKQEEINRSSYRTLRHAMSRSSQDELAAIAVARHRPTIRSSRIRLAGRLQTEGTDPRGLAVEEANAGVMLLLVTTSGFDIILVPHDGADELRGTCVYKTNLFSPTVIDRMLQGFQQVFESIVKISAIRVSLNQRKLNWKSNTTSKGVGCHGKHDRSLQGQGSGRPHRRG
jgi:hypothetical protein